MDVELLAEPGCTWVDGEEIHLWHLGPTGAGTTLCELRLDPPAAARPVARWTEVFPERLCPVCRRRYTEQLPVGGVPPGVGLAERDGR